MTRFTVEPEAMIVPCLVWLLCGDGALAALLLVSALHELGHLAAILFCGGFVREMKIGFSGAEIVCDGLEGKTGRFLAAISGPAAGLVPAGMMFLSCGVRFQGAGIMGLLSLFLSLFNLLPASPLDGGQALRALIGSDGDILKFTDRIVLVLLWALSVYVFVALSSPLLLPGTISLTICCCNTWRKGVK